MALNLIRARS